MFHAPSTRKYKGTIIVTLVFVSCTMCWGFDPRAETCNGTLIYTAFQKMKWPYIMSCTAHIAGGGKIFNWIHWRNKGERFLSHACIPNTYQTRYQFQIHGALVLPPPEPYLLLFFLFYLNIMCACIDNVQLWYKRA